MKSIMSNQINYIGEAAAKAIYKRCKDKHDALAAICANNKARIDIIESEAANVKPIEDEEIIDIVSKTNVSEIQYFLLWD